VILLTIIGVVMLAALLLVLSLLPADACCYRYLGTLQNVRTGEVIKLHSPHVREWHHGYCLVLAGVPWWPLQAAALVLGADDLFQHLVQLYGRPVYRSPLHRLAAVTWYKWRRPP
jgi:hypothetical protein